MTTGRRPPPPPGAGSATAAREPSSFCAPRPRLRHPGQLGVRATVASRPPQTGPPAFRPAPATPGRPPTRQAPTFAGEHGGRRPPWYFHDRPRRWRSLLAGGPGSGRTASSAIRNRPFTTVRVQYGDVLGAQFQQGLAPARAWARASVAAGEDEGGHPGGGLQIDACSRRRRCGRWSARTGGSCRECPACRRTAPTADHRNAADVPTEIQRVSMVAALCRALVKAAMRKGQRRRSPRAPPGSATATASTRTATPAPSPSRRPGRTAPPR